MESYLGGTKKLDLVFQVLLTLDTFQFQLVINIWKKRKGIYLGKLLKSSYFLPNRI